MPGKENKIITIGPNLRVGALLPGREDGGLSVGDGSHLRHRLPWRKSRAVVNIQ